MRWCPGRSPNTSPWRATQRSLRPSMSIGCELRVVRNGSRGCDGDANSVAGFERVGQLATDRSPSDRGLRDELVETRNGLEASLERRPVERESVCHGSQDRESDQDHLHGSPRGELLDRPRHGDEEARQHGDDEAKLHEVAANPDQVEHPQREWDDSAAQSRPVGPANREVRVDRGKRHQQVAREECSPRSRHRAESTFRRPASRSRCSGAGRRSS